MSLDRSKHEGHVRLFPVRDEVLHPVQEEVICLCRSAHPEIGRIRPGLGLAQAKAAQLLPLGERDQKAPFLVLRAELEDWIAYQGVIDRHDDPGGGAGATDLLDRNGVAGRIRSGPPVCLWDGHSHQSQLSHLPDGLGREAGLLVDFGGPRRHLLFGKAPDHFLEHLLLLGQPEIHALPR